MSTMIESLAQIRHAERYHRSQRAAAARRGAADARRNGSALENSLENGFENTLENSLENTSSRAGWLLVGLGLRLVLPGRHAAAHRITLIGR